MPLPPPIRLLLIDDHAVVRMGLAAVLEAAADDFKVVAQGDGGGSAIPLIRQHQPDVTLLDLRMPRISGIETLKAIRMEFPAARVLILSSSNIGEDIVQSLDAGAAGYLVKTAPPEELVLAIRAVRAGERYLPASCGGQDGG